MTLRRMKTYTGGQGYVYQYYFVGRRVALAGSATEYIFDVTSDRKSTYSVSVLLLDEAVQSWVSAHGRSITEAEQYAAAKMRLFKAFDEIEDMMAEGRNLTIDAEILQNSLATLQVE